MGIESGYDEISNDDLDWLVLEYHKKTLQEGNLTLLANYVL